mmetsp:Transcript_28823/g.46636  ORF Transcript_28823/g.46636 Transcript_28823/m.46636 type:complete len:143 (+) Transcript_28823:111-539(+)
MGSRSELAVFLLAFSCTAAAVLARDWSKDTSRQLLSSQSWANINQTFCYSFDMSNGFSSSFRPPCRFSEPACLLPDVLNVGHYALKSAGLVHLRYDYDNDTADYFIHAHGHFHVLEGVDDKYEAIALALYGSTNIVLSEECT